MELDRASGDSIAHAGRALTPFSTRVRLVLPFRAGGLVWNRPLAIEVEGPNGRQVLPVPDRTRQIQWLLWGLGLAVGLLARSARRRRARRRRLSRR